MTEKTIDFAQLKIRDKDKLEKIKNAALEFLENPNVDLAELAAKHGLKLKSIMHYFRKLEELGILTLKTTEKTGIAQAVIRKTEVKILSGEAERIATLVLGVGGPLIRHYLPLFDKLLLQGKSVDDIALDVGEWYSLRLTTKRYIADLELQLEKMQTLVAEAWTLARPNFKVLLKARLTDKFARDIFRAKRLGLPINLKKVNRDYAIALEKIDRDLEDERTKIVVATLQELGVYDEKAPNFFVACQKGLWLLQNKINKLVDEKNG